MQWHTVCKVECMLSFSELAFDAVYELSIALNTADDVKSASQLACGIISEKLQLSSVALRLKGESGFYTVCSAPQLQGGFSYKFARGKEPEKAEKYLFPHPPDTKPLVAVCYPRENPVCILCCDYTSASEHTYNEGISMLERIAGIIATWYSCRAMLEHKLDSLVEENSRIKSQIRAVADKLGDETGQIGETPQHTDSEKERVLQALKQSGWVQAKAARLLGMSVRQVNYRIKKYSINVMKF